MDVIDVALMTGLTKVAVFKLICAGQFPRPIATGAGTATWSREDVMHWLAARAAETESEKRSAPPGWVTGPQKGDACSGEHCDGTLAAL